MKYSTGYALKIMDVCMWIFVIVLIVKAYLMLGGI
jgi:hypothetical protein